MPLSRRLASDSPLGVPSGRSTWLSSPVTIIFDPWPIRVKNISIWDFVVFWASSRITTDSLSVLPRMNASGMTSIRSLVMKRRICSYSIMSCRASNSGRRYGLTFACMSPGRNPSFSPASTAGRTSTRRLACLCLSMWTANATARYVLPVPAGPVQKTMSQRRIASM